MLLGLTACAPALKTPPDLLELARTERPIRASRVDKLLGEARNAFARRTLLSVSESIDLALLAAAGDVGRTEGLQQAVRASAWLIDHEKAAARRKELSVRAVQAAQWCETITPEDPACQYWLAVSMGLQARERRSTGLDALPRIEKAFLTSAEEIPEFERGGPARALALFYVRAPGWPSGPGDPDEGLRHAKQAVAIDPSYAPNHLALAESLEAIEAKSAARSSWEKARQLASQSSEPDASEWDCTAARALNLPCAKKQ